jgi:hypothetical protein
MKKILLAALLLLNIVCFGQKIDIKTSMKQSILRYNKQHLKDPSSYQLMNLNIISTETLGDMNMNSIYRLVKTNNELKEGIEQNNIEIKYTEKKITVYRESEGNEISILKCYESIGNFKKDNNSRNERINENQIEIDKRSNEKSLNEKYIVYYFVEHKYRAKNGFGGLDIQTDLIKFDSTFKILEVETK